MATRLQDFREQYPQYADYSDEELATALHEQYYQDIPLEQYRQEIGLPEPEPPPPEPTAWERVKGFFGASRETPEGVLREDEDLLEPFDVEPQRPGGVTTRGQRRLERQAERDALGETAPDPESRQGGLYRDQLFAGLDEYLALWNDQRALDSASEFGQAEAMALGRSDGPGASGGFLGASGGQISRQARAARAAAGDQEARTAIRTEVANRREQLLEDMQEAMDAGQARRRQAETVQFSESTENLLQAETFGEGFGEFAGDPVNIAMEISLRSLPNMAEAVPLAMAGALAGPAGFAAGMGLGAGRAEYRAAYSEYLQKAGVDMNNARSLLGAVENQELMRAAHNYAGKRSTAVGAFTALGGAAMTRTLAVPVKSVLGRELQNVAAQTGVQAVTGAAGEVGAQALTQAEREAMGEQAFAPGEILAEGIGEAGPVNVLADVGAATLSGVRADQVKREAARVEAEVNAILGRGELADPQDDVSRETPEPVPDPEAPTPEPDWQPEEDLGPDPAEEETGDSTRVRWGPDDYQVRVDQAYDGGWQDVTVIDPDGRETMVTLEPGESLDQAVDLVESFRLEAEAEGIQRRERQAEPPAEPELEPDAGMELEPAAEPDVEAVYNTMTQLFPDQSFLAPADNEQVAELAEEIRRQGVVGALTDWYELTEAEAATLAERVTGEYGQALVPVDQPLEGEVVEPRVAPTPPDPSPPRYVDVRLKREPFRQDLQRMADELQVNGGGMGALIRAPAYPGESGELTGEVIGRVPSSNPPWFQELNTDPQTRMSVKDVQKAVEKAITGRARMGVRQARVVQALLDVITDERTSFESIEYAGEQLDAARESRREARARAGLEPDPFADWRGELLNEDEYDAEATALARIAQELMDEAVAAGVDEEVLELLAIRHDDTQAFIDALEAQINEQRNQDGFIAPSPQPGERPASDEAEDTDAVGEPTEQLELYLEQPPVETQAGAPDLDQAKVQAVDAIANLRSMPEGLPREMAAELAENQRTSLVGATIESMHDLAALAQLYRDPRFETLRLYFIDGQTRVVSQLGLSSRLPASAQVFIGEPEDFIASIQKAAREAGAVSFYMSHNHPSGISNPSQADEMITAKYAKMFRQGPNALKFQGHVVTDRDNYSTIAPNTYVVTANLLITPRSPEYLKRTGGVAGTRIGGPQDVIALFNQVTLDSEAVVLVKITQRNVVLQVSLLEAAQIDPSNKSRTRRAVLRASLSTPGTGQVIAVARDKRQLMALQGFILDGILIENDGSMVSLSQRGTFFAGSAFPGWRTPRITADTSAEFDYLKPWSVQERTGASQVTLGVTEQQGDLFGGKSEAEQDIADEIRRRDAKRNAGQESLETGDPSDLFSQATEQIDVEDQLTRDIEDQIEERRGQYPAQEQTREERIRSMRLEDLVNAVYADELTGAGNLKAYNEEGKFWPVKGVVDVDSLKWVNDNLGLDAGDALLVAVAEALDQDGVEVYRIGGDEFIVTADNELELRAALELTEGILANQAVESPKGRHQGLGITWGIGRTKSEGDTLLKRRKGLKEAQGQRAARGEKPPGATLSVKANRPVDMAAGTNYVPMIGKHGKLPITPNNNLVLGNGRVVRLPKTPVRREHILAVMRQYFGNRIYEGRVKGKLRLGFYRPGQGEIRLRNHNDIEVAAHEIAHFLDDRYPWIARLYKSHAEEMRGVSYDSKLVFEGYAEFMRLYLTQEWAAMERAPSFYDAWQRELAKDGRLENMLHDLQELMHAWTMQGARARAASKMGSAEAPIWEKFLNAYRVPFAQGFLDGLRRIKLAERAINPDQAIQVAYEKARIAMGGSHGVVEAAFLYGTPGWRADGQGLEFTGESLSEIFGNHWGDHDVGMYLLARRADELQKQGRENLMRPDEIAAWLTLGDERPELVDIFDRYQAWNDRMLDFYQGSGIVGAEARAKMQEMNKSYVPFFRVMESMINKGVATAGGNPFQRLKGGTQNVQVVWENIINGLGWAVKAALINDAKRSLFQKMGGIDKLGEGKRNQAAGLFAAPISTDARPVGITGDQVLRAAVDAMGWTMAEYRMAKEGFVASEDDIAKVQAIEAMEQGLPEFVTLFQMNQDPSGNVDKYLADGKGVWFEIIDPALMDSLEFMGPKGTNLAFQIFGGFSAALRRGVVAWPTFQTKNFVRDTLNSWMLSSNIKVPGAQATRVLLEKLQADPAYREMVLNGGGFATRAQAFDVARKVIVDPSDLLHRYDRFMARFENANRLAEYKAGVDDVGPRRAAMLSREISTDFAMRGSNAIARALAISVPFLNARVQGLYRVARQFDSRQMAISMAMRGTSLAIAGLALYALNKDDERYKELPEDVKDLYWVFFTGPGEDEYFLLAKPFELGMIFGTLPERLAELVETLDGEEFGDALLWMFLQTFNMDVVPQVFQPWRDLERNKDFTGGPIIPFYLRNVEPSEQFSYYTSETSKAAGRALNISPMKMDYVIRGYLGTLGTYMLGMSDAVIRAATDPYLDPVTGEEFAGGEFGEKPTRGETWRENILVKGLVDWTVREGPPRRTKYVTDLYDMVREIETLANTMALQQRRNSERAAVYLNDPERQWLMSLHPFMQDTRRELNKLRRQMDNIRADRTMDGDEKRVEIWNLTRARNELARVSVTAVEEAERMLTAGASVDDVREFLEQVAAGATRPAADDEAELELAARPGEDSTAAAGAL